MTMIVGNVHSGKELGAERDKVIFNNNTGSKKIKNDARVKEKISATDVGMVESGEGGQEGIWGHWCRKCSGKGYYFCD